jgi:hypothetical protein
MLLSSSTLFRAAQLAEEIESLQQQLSILLDNQDGEHPASRAKKTEIPSSTDLAESERGTLGSAVLKVLKESKDALNAAAIYESLVSSGYRFSSKEPKKVLQIRLYKMAGVQKVGKGLFKAK